MESSLIRRKFLEFFKQKGHLIVPSAPLVLKNDPTLLFTNSGMVQFKDYFLGNSDPKSNRIVDTQKCLRVSGKHNDLEEVGIDTYHHTLFEMLGNWSFGDYFKKEAISWGWELLTDVFGLPQERLYVTVFGGDQDDNLTEDAEAYNLWKPIVGEERIVYGSKKDNFWEMGETGPCGPCSEIHIDMRPEDEVLKRPGKELVNKDHPQVIEIWNLVFMEFNRKADRSLEKLPAKHVDTGMGFERLCMAIQGKASTYETDVFMPLLGAIAKEAGIKYGMQEKTDIALRVMADHTRAVSFAIADGQLPSNTGAGYVIRRILRRAVRYGFSFLNFSSPFMYKLVAVLANQMKEAFPELNQQKDFVAKVIMEEETAFLRTLENGLKRLDTLETNLDHKTISGDQAFELYDTFGFPFDLTTLIAREKGLQVDTKGFDEEMAKQKTRSKKDAEKETGDWTIVGDEVKSEFIGYDHLEAQVHIVKYREVTQKNKKLFQLVFDRTPFYAESGGQVGDHGYLKTDSGKIPIIDTKKENELIVHFTAELPQPLDRPFNVEVDSHKRLLTTDNHSATHLLHAALRQVLGGHVEQRGSLVNEKMLRFDFSHFSAMTEEEVQQVEDLVNKMIRTNIPLDEKRNVPIDKAKELGAMALFGEKYGEFVRVITFDPQYSVELCGGTHVSATGQIGLFKIIAESSVAAGVRRIEAITAWEAEKYVQHELEQLKQLRQLFKNPKDLLGAAQALQEEKIQLEKKMDGLYQEKANHILDELSGKALLSHGVNFIIERISVPTADALKNIAYGLRNKFDDLFLVLAAEVDAKPQIAVMLGEKLTASKKYHAGNIVKELAKEIQGGGGGQPFFATAGGKKLEGLEQVVVKARKFIEE